MSPGTPRAGRCADGAGLLRQHICPTDLIHGIVTLAGVARALIYVR